DLAAHDWIGFDPGLETAQSKWLTKTVPRPRYALRVNTTSAQVAACAAGHGIALLPGFAGVALAPVLPRLRGPTREVWSVVHRDVHRMARVAAVSAWLGRVFEGVPLG